MARSVVRPEGRIGRVRRIAEIHGNLDLHLVVLDLPIVGRALVTHGAGGRAAEAGVGVTILRPGRDHEGKHVGPSRNGRSSEDILVGFAPVAILVEVYPGGQRAGRAGRHDDGRRLTGDQIARKFHAILVVVVHAGAEDRATNGVVITSGNAIGLAVCLPIRAIAEVDAAQEVARAVVCQQRWVRAVRRIAEIRVEVHTDLVGGHVQAAGAGHPSLIADLGHGRRQIRPDGRREDDRDRIAIGDVTDIDDKVTAQAAIARGDRPLSRGGSIRQRAMQVEVRIHSVGEDDARSRQARRVCGVFDGHGEPEEVARHDGAAVDIRDRLRRGHHGGGVKHIKGHVERRHRRSIYFEDNSAHIGKVSSRSPDRRKRGVRKHDFIVPDPGREGVCDHRVIVGVGVYCHCHSRVQIGKYHYEIERVLRPTLCEIDSTEAGVVDVVAIVIITVPHDLRPCVDGGILGMGVPPPPHTDIDTEALATIDQVHFDVALAAQQRAMVNRRCGAGADVTRGGED